MRKNQRAEYYLPYLSNTLLDLGVSPNCSKDKSIIAGSLLFADLSGFTAMSEKLAALGRAGGEKLAGIMNGCFDPLLDIVAKHNGDIIKFGGDAFLALFKQGNHAEIAFSCGNELINWVNEHGLISTPVGQFKLGIHAGISTGKIFNLNIGGNRGHHEHLFCGETVEQAYAAADIAELGQLALSNSAAENLPDIEKTQTTENYYICEALKDTGRIVDTAHSSNRKIENMPDLCNYVITNLASLIEYNNGSVEGEHRILTNLFIGIKSIRENLERDFDRSLPAVNKYFAVINEIIEKHQGVVARLDSSSSSEKMLVFFGAPKSSGQDAQNCLKAVLEIESSLPELNKNFSRPIKHRYGINTGLCFVGDVGGSKRREYTAMGDAINLAARLMSKAEYDKILVGEQTAKIAGKGFVLSDFGEIKVKGKEAAVQVYNLHNEEISQRNQEEMIGRESEFEISRSFVHDIRNGYKSFLLIHGDAGAGKSLFCSKTVALANSLGLRIANGVCYKHAGLTPYEPLKEVLLSLLELPEQAAQKQRRQALSEYLNLLGECEWEPLLAPLLGYDLPIPPHLMNIPDEIKKSKTRDIICRLIVEINRRNASLIVIDDMQWIDDASYEIIKALLKTPNSPGILFIARPGNICDELQESQLVKAIELGPLSESNARKLFLWALGGLIPEESIIKQAIEKSVGNPFYLEELAKAFRELGQERFASGENIPAGIESVITARIDNLGEMVKRTLRTASVIGRVFAFKTLRSIYPDNKRSAYLRGYLDELNQLDLTPLERRQPILEYIFKHILTQEVAYNGLSFSSRQALHLKTADYFAGQPKFSRIRPELPAHHYLLAGEELKALPFLYNAAVKAAKQFANKEAIGHYTQAIEIAQKHQNTEYLIKAIRGRGNLAKQTSEFKSAIADFLWLKEIAISREIKIDVLKNLSEIFRITAEYEKSENAIDELLAIGETEPDLKVFCLNGRAEIIRRKGKLPACREILIEATGIIQNQRVSDDIQATVFNHLGICLWSLGKLNESAQYYRKALTLYRKLKDLNGQSKVVNNLGIISDKMGKFSQATRAYQKAEKIFQRIGAARSQACACANLGTLNSSSGLLNDAAAKIIEAMQIFERIGDQRGYAFAVGDLGYVYYAMADYELAEAHFKKAISLGRQLDDDEFILENELRLGRLNLLLNKQMDFSLTELTKKAQDIGSLELEAKCLVLECWHKYHLEDFPGLDYLLGKIPRSSGLDDFPEIQIEIAKLQAISDMLNGREAKAYERYLYAINNSLRRDLTLQIGELVEIGQGLNLFDKLPEKLQSKIKIQIERFYQHIDEAAGKRCRAQSAAKISHLQVFLEKTGSGPKTRKSLAKSHTY